MRAPARRRALGANFLVLACATWWCPAAGFFPGLALRLPPLLSSEVREKLCAGWTEVQVATHGIRAEWSEMHQQYRDKLDEIRGDAYEYASGTIYYPDERQYYHTDKPIRASLEVLAALPDAGHAELDECIRETEAAKAITHPIGYGRRFISWRIRASCRPLKRRLSGLIGPRKPGCGANSTNSLPLSSISTR